jgi:hypothetical protein
MGIGAQEEVCLGSELQRPWSWLSDLRLPDVDIGYGEDREKTGAGRERERQWQRQFQSLAAPRCASLQRAQELAPDQSRPTQESVSYHRQLNGTIHSRFEGNRRVLSAPAQPFFPTLRSHIAQHLPESGTTRLLSLRDLASLCATVHFLCFLLWGVLVVVPFLVQEERARLVDWASNGPRTGLDSTFFWPIHARFSFLNSLDPFFALLSLGLKDPRISGPSQLIGWDMW